MTTALAVHDAAQEAAPAIVHTIPGTALTFGDTARLAKTLHASGLLGNKIRSPEQAFAIIVAGAELGLPPMLSLRSVALIDGKPIVAADVQLGAFKRAGGRATFHELSDARAVLWLKHPNGDEHTESFTLEDARAAGLTNKDNWRKFPKAMLRSRVITAGLKSVGFEPTAGMYDPDEVQHFAGAGNDDRTQGVTDGMREVQGRNDRTGAHVHAAAADDGEGAAERGGVLDMAWSEQRPVRGSASQQSAEDVRASDDVGTDSRRDSAGYGDRASMRRDTLRESDASLPRDAVGEPSRHGGEGTRAEAESRVSCPKCGGPTWDNRATKKNPKAPDFKCRDTNCDGVYWSGQWPPKKDQSQDQSANQATSEATAEAPRDFSVCPAGPNTGKPWTDTEAFSATELRKFVVYFAERASDAPDPSVPEGYAAAVNAELERRLAEAKAATAKPRGNAMDAADVPEQKKARSTKARDTETDEIPF